MHTCADAVFMDGRVKPDHDGPKLKPQEPPP